jgi:hypothetical protein
MAEYTHTRRRRQIVASGMRRDQIRLRFVRRMLIGAL